MEVQNSPMPCVQHCRARQDINLRTFFLSICHLTGCEPAGMSPLRPCQQASCSILNLLRPIFPWLHVQFAALVAVPRQQPSSDVTGNLFFCWHPSEGGVCIIPMALDGRNLIYRVKPHEIQNLNLVPPLLVCIPLYSFFFFPLCYIIELLPLVPSLNSYSRPPLPTETAFLKVSDVFSDLVRHKWEERGLSQFLFQRTQSFRKRNWALFTEVPDQTPLISGRARISLGVYPFANDFVIDEGVDSVSI